MLNHLKWNRSQILNQHGIPNVLFGDLNRILFQVIFRLFVFCISNKIANTGRELKFNNFAAFRLKYTVIDLDYPQIIGGTNLYCIIWSLVGTYNMWHIRVQHWVSGSTTLECNTWSRVEVQPLNHIRLQHFYDFICEVLQFDVVQP